MAELAYGFVHKMVEDVAGREGLKYFPYIMTLFMFVAFSNMLGLLPMSFTTTSHFAVTVVLALAVFLSVTVIGFVKNGASFLELFWVKAAPLPLRPILAVIEIPGSSAPLSFVTQCAAVRTQRSPISEPPHRKVNGAERMLRLANAGHFPAAAGVPPTIAGVRADALEAPASAAQSRTSRMRRRGE